ncbi:MAG: histidine kinase [Bacteroidetes bacterium]|nr:histidine kinase [Bacteroidota bacterium]
MLSKFIICLLIVSLTSDCFSQKYKDLKIYNTDSLSIILPTQKGEERVQTLNKLALSLFFKDFKLGEQYAQEAMSLSNEIDYQEGIALTYRTFGRFHYYQGNYPDAVGNFLESLRIYEKLDMKYLVARVYYEVAESNYFVGNYEKALEYGYISLDKFREPMEGGTSVGSIMDIAHVKGGLGFTYAAIGRFDKSLEYLLELFETGKKSDMDSTEMIIITFLVGAYNFATGENEKAKFYFNEAFSYPDINQDIQALKHRPLIWMGDIYFSEGKMDSAIYFKQKGFEWFNKRGFLYWTMVASNDLGLVYYKMNDFNTAENYYRHAEKIFNEILTRNSIYRYDSLKNIISYGHEYYGPLNPAYLKELYWTQGRIMYNKLYQINNAKNRKNEALYYHIAYSDAKDTLNKILRGRETMELQIKYESERKDQQIATLSLENELKESRLNQNRYLLFGSGGLLIVVIMFGYILIRQNKLKTEQQMLNLQQKLFRSQMNPHFIFNSLASIQNFVVRQDSKKASVYLSRFSELVRSILDNSTQDYIPFEKEVSTIENYLELQKIRFPDKFDFSIEIDEKIDPENMLIPPMLAQPFIENSIEHGFKHKKAKGNIKIRFVLNENLIVFEIEDDGIGRQKAQEIGYKLRKDHRSMATDITRERLMVLNKKLKHKISLIISDLMNEQNEPAGTKVVFDIPFKYS